MNMPVGLAVKLTVLCSGVNAEGKAFEERTRTTAIDKGGGRLLSQQKLRSGSRVQLRLLARPDRSAEAVIGEAVQKSSEGAEWSFEFSPPIADFWGVRFPDEALAASSEAGATAGSALAEMTEQLVLLAAHADDHLRYCTQEMEVLRQRFARELQGALDAGARQLQQLARSTMQTTFRSLLEDLARRAEETVDERLNHLRKALDEASARYAKDRDTEAEAEFKKFHERLEKQGRQFIAPLEEAQAGAQRALQEAMQEALTDFQAGCVGLLRDLLHSTETHKPPRAAARRK